MIFLFSLFSFFVVYYPDCTIVMSWLWEDHTNIHLSITDIDHGDLIEFSTLQVGTGTRAPILDRRSIIDRTKANKIQESASGTHGE